MGRPAATSTLRHFGFLTQEQRSRLFAVPPQAFDRGSPPARLALALGATLYSPGTRHTLARDAERAAAIGTTSMVWCLEDAIAHEAVPGAERTVAAALRSLAVGAGQVALPLLFVRVRTPEQVPRLLALAGHRGAAALAGFVLPKFDPASGDEFLSAVEAASEQAGRRLYAMPVLETPALAWRETRGATLAELRELCDAHRDTVLALRVGATDLCGLFGLRRDRDTTIWDVAVVRDALADIVNVFGRRGDYLLTGAVWEHVGGARLRKPQLRSTPFEGVAGQRLRAQLVRDDVDELMREVALDGANGFTGKTVIHPAHVSVVNALLTVTRAEYDDALTVLAGRSTGGVSASAGGETMLEFGPHALWAEQVSARAALYGVLAEPGALVELLAAGREVALRRYASARPLVP